ncbi:DNA helicase Pif1-like protein [Artemisia annua]|uniref:DNA helicase Pif1-like protein n=1 Tax=Artemisia annua TaxID=35608 RepID=A0A2U1LFQ6_ARTAN|nr:DNA helicase Pif1-like protein [Artemisia annua]
MKQKSKTTPENIRPHLCQNQKINIRDNTHGLVDCHAQNNNKQNYGCARFVPSSASSISSATVDKLDADSLKANIHQKSSNVKNHEAEIHYARVVGTSQSGPPDFFTPSRRKQSNLFRHLGRFFYIPSFMKLYNNLEGNTIGASYPDAVTQGIVVRLTTTYFKNACKLRIQVLSSSERGRPRDEFRLTPMHHDCVQVNPLAPLKEGIANSFDHRCKRNEENLTLGVCPTLNGSVHDTGEGSSSDVMKESLPPKRKRGRPRNTCKTTPAKRNCLGSNAQVHASSVMHTPLQSLQLDANCFSDASQRQEETIEPATRYVHQQNSMVDLHANLDTSLDDTGEGPSSNVIEQTFRQTRKRGRPRNASTSVRVRQCSSVRTASPHSVASPITEMANSHVTESATQPCKRTRRTHQSSAPCGNDHSQNITEGSTSYAPDRDCTECCNYCNAAFWRGERLAGHGYAGHVSHYHLCCGNDSPPLDPEIVQGLIHFLDAHNELVQIFRTARDKCAGADVPEFKIRLYSGEGPRGYELPSSNTLGAIVFDRGPESESNYDVVLEYRNGPVKRISKIHKSYMSLQFPLIFIYGQPGFHTKLMLRTANPDDEPKRLLMYTIILPFNKGFYMKIDANCFSDASQRQEETIEPATRYVHQQNSMVDLHANLDTSLDDTGEGPSSNVIEQTFRQTRKRGRPRNASTSVRVHQCSSVRTASPHSVASPITEMANSHVTESATQPCKRTRRTHQSSAPCGNDHSQNITEGSTSYAPDNTSPAYDDLGDCTECCNYCNAAFWRGERLAGHGYAGHVSHYHLCCGNGKVFMQPEPDPPEYIKQLLGDSAVNLPKKDVEQAKELHKHNLETPDKMVIGTQETSGTPPESIALIKQKTLKTADEHNTPQESSTKIVKRVLFENQPSQSKKQKALIKTFIRTYHVSGNLKPLNRYRRRFFIWHPKHLTHPFFVFFSFGVNKSSSSSGAPIYQSLFRRSPIISCILCLSSSSKTV